MNSGHTSQKLKALGEVAAGLAAVLWYLWFIFPLYEPWIKIAVGVPMLAFLMLRDLLGKTSLRELGFRWDNWRSSARVLAICTLVIIPVFCVVWMQFFPVDPRFYERSSFWERLAIYPLWALFQQYILLVFFFRRYRAIFPSRVSIAVLLTGLTFAVVHLPNPPLLVLCFVAGLVFSAIYHRYPNLYTISISHAVLGTFVSQVLMVYGTVGPNAHLGKWSKREQAPARGNIESVDGRAATRKDRLFTLDAGATNFVVQGRVFAAGEITGILLNFDGMDLPADASVEPADPDAPGGSTGNLYRFSATVPIAEPGRRYHPLKLKVYVAGRKFYWSPTRKKWITIGGARSGGNQRAVP